MYIFFFFFPDERKMVHSFSTNLRSQIYYLGVTSVSPLIYGAVCKFYAACLVSAGLSHILIFGFLSFLFYICHSENSINTRVVLNYIFVSMGDLPYTFFYLRKCSLVQFLKILFNQIPELMNIMFKAI